jgi:hypothetical protein
MAQITSSPVAYDCRTCKAPVYFHEGSQQWRHINRTAECKWIVVATVELFVKPVKLDVAA